MLNIILLSYSNSIKINSASYNRTIGYAKGLNEIGFNVKFIFAANPKKGIDKIGLIDGVSYEFIGENRNHYTIFDRVLSDFLLFNKTCKKLLNEKTNFSNTIVKIPVNNPFLSAKYLKCCMSNNLYTFQERSEFPEVILKTSPIKRIIKKIELSYYYKHILPSIDFMVLMTKTLIEFYSEYVSKKCKIFHMPMTVDVERFEDVELYTPGFKYIAYCGSMNKKKDGVHILVKAFNNVVKKNKDIKLLLIGPQKPKKQFKEIKEIISSNSLENNVIFTGLIDSSEIPKYLCGAEALCLARPDSKQAQGGFPTKLGEYLLTRKPVVVTKVGEIPNYLSDKENCFMAEPNRIESFSNKLEEAINNKEASQIGHNGHDVAMSIFNTKIQSKRLGEFFEKNI